MQKNHFNTINNLSQFSNATCFQIQQLIDTKKFQDVFVFILIKSIGLLSVIKFNAINKLKTV